MERNEKEESFLVGETNGINIRRTYHVVPSKTIDQSHKIIVKEDNLQWKSLTCFFLDVFLPHGYPNSVSKDYTQYQIWDSIQAFSSSISTSLSTHAVLKGVGVGNENATPLAATITWLIKDGTSMVGRIVFAWLQGTKLDSDCKKWRLFADILNDISILLDLLSAHFQSNFLIIICISGLFKSLVGVAGGATRAALTQHQARSNNMADVSAKDGSQETLVNLLALICSLTILPLVSESFVITWMLFFTMTTIHLIANYFAVKSVRMESFNKERFRIYAKHYISTNLKECLTIDEVNKQEGVFLSIWKPAVTISLGVSFKDIIQHRNDKDIKRLLKIYEQCDYVLCLSHYKRKFKIDVILDKKATELSQMEALYQACFLEYKLCHKTENLHSSYLDSKDAGEDFESASRNFAVQTFPIFKRKTESKGFKLTTVLFDTDIWRAEW